MKEGKAVRISSMNGIVNDNVANPTGNQWHQKSHPAACVPTRTEQCHGAHRRIIPWMRHHPAECGGEYDHSHGTHPCPLLVVYLFHAFKITLYHHLFFSHSIIIS